MESLNIDFEKAGGLVPAIIQDHRSGDVLMLGFMNSVSLAETQRSGQVVFFSRSRNKLWKKGESSGHVLRVREVRVDCDADALLLRVEAVGPGVCHEGYRSCFFRLVVPGWSGGSNRGAYVRRRNQSMARRNRRKKHELSEAWNSQRQLAGCNARSFCTRGLEDHA